MKTFANVGLFIAMAAQTVSASVIYNASLGTLPQAQGFTYSGDNGNPSPSVSLGQLHEVKNVLNTAQGWTIPAALDVSQHVYFQGIVQINSSNYVPNVGTGTREGYYFILSDLNSLGYDIGLSDAGFSINTVGVPNAPLIPYPVAGAPHIFTLDVNNSLANFYIDGVLEQSNIAPYFSGTGLNVNIVEFGGTAGASVSNSDLRSVCATASGTCSVAGAVPEPSGVVLGGSSVLFLLFMRRLCRSSFR